MKALKYLVIIFLLHSSAPALAADSAGDSAEKRSISEFVSPDGRIDINAVRMSGYQGPLDLKGFDVGIDPNTGEPLVQVSASTPSLADPNDIYWDNSLSPSFQEVNGPVYALAVYDSNLIMGGEFTAAGDVSANYIASWDGTSWSTLGTGMAATTFPHVYALTVYDNQLIAGGFFTTAGSVSADFIASWDGISWSALGSGMNNRVRALTVHNSKLIAGGDFTTAGSVSANYIAPWNGTSWSPLGAADQDAPFGVSNSVFALTVYANQLIAGGSFIGAGVCLLSLLLPGTAPPGRLWAPG